VAGVFTGGATNARYYGIGYGLEGGGFSDAR
jgi:hypothetical protein